MLHMRKPTRALMVASIAFVFLGCGGSKGSSIQFTGTIILPDKLKLIETDDVKLKFLPEDESGGVPATAKVSSGDLTFTLKGQDLKGGPLPGKYKVVVQITPYVKTEAGDDSEKRLRDELLKKLNKNYGARDTTMKYEITSDPTQSVSIDLRRGVITKK